MRFFFTLGKGHSMKTPDNIPLLMGKGHDNIVRDVLANPEQPVMNIYRLSQAFHIKVIFKEPITLQLNRRKVKQNVKEHIFKNPFFIRHQYVWYPYKKNGNNGEILPVSKIESYEPIPNSIDQFDCYEQFRDMFDPFFIEEDLIRSLWDSNSAQHGERYKPSDFKSLSSNARSALRMFLINFKGINKTDKDIFTKRVIGGKDYYTLSGSYYGLNKDIRISHQFGTSCVGYKSEVSGGGSNTNGIIATKSKYLWTEND